MFGEFQASGRCFAPAARPRQPVRSNLLLVLPTGNKYEYRCAVCGHAG